MTNNDWTDPTQEAVKTEEVQPDETDASSQLKKKIIILFAAVAVLTFSLAGSYLVARVGHASPTSKVAQVAPKQAPAPAPVQAAVAKPSPIQPTPTPAPHQEAAAKEAATKEVAMIAKPAPPAATESKVAPPKPVVVPELPPPAKSSPVAAAPAKAAESGVITPHSGDKYLQVGAMASRLVPVYVKELEAKGLHPLVGPFTDRSAMKKASLDLEAQGITSFPQVY